MLMLLLGLLKPLQAEEKYTELKQGEPAPYAGILLTKEAIAKIYTDQELEIGKLKIEHEYQLNTLSLTEKTKYDPRSPYSASKASSDHFVRAYGETYSLPFYISNCSNNYGPYQFPEKLIPLIIANCFDKKPLPVYGNGENIRDCLW